MDFKAWRPPAITTGLIPFMAILQTLNLYDTLKLTPDAVFHIDLNRLSFYPLVARNWLFLISYWFFFPLVVGPFELKNGTVRTGVVLNVVAVFVAVAYNILAKLSGGIFTNSYSGVYVWMVAMSAILSRQIQKLPPITVKSVVITIPSFVAPIVMYLGLSVAGFTREGFLVNGLGLLMGFGLAYGQLGFLVEGTTNVIEWIESKLEVGINYLRYIVNFVGEVEARELRKGPQVIDDALPV